MTTTVKLDPDVEEMVRKEMVRSQKSFEETLNTMLRCGYQSQGKAAAQNLPPYAPHFLELREGIDPLKIRQYADELADQEFIEKMNARQKAKGKESL